MYFIDEYCSIFSYYNSLTNVGITDVNKHANVHMPLTITFLKP
ncbi:hypothetical protein QEW_0370 [Clostridioides difficile CD160]|nr:hypothetical protein QEW_0370 [Clostridioides difficile CD160]